MVQKTHLLSHNPRSDYILHTLITTKQHIVKKEQEKFIKRIVNKPKI